MPTISEKIATINGSGEYRLEDEILSLGETLRQQDAVAYARVIIKLASGLSLSAKDELAGTLQSPELTFGIFKDDPVWAEVEQAIERNRQRDREESATE